ncbi:flagellar type III secretion system pore protein FliP [Eubacterium oxidoreducens]|uniref:Flagellar biosynthetic protein FliP n=1 Tax=Eubacterium oxidoreducens TaxID=1732 RepID=A0A1G6AQD9_EUBOX|nr:flagellar type III secretion system pore protein FliP [Eubacterium oxidoreducens]SDB10413.1 flagellar biosynthetic protein FliP [Eubacterium oxidoreducens]
MNKIKKFYCSASVVFAIFVLVLTIAFAFSPTHAYATESDAAAAADALQDLQVDSTSGAADASDDLNNGISIVYNNDSGSLSGAIRILLVLTVISLAPSILIMLTSFTRIIIVLHFVRSAIGTQTAPPNQVLIGLALFLTLFIMAPIFSQINEEAIKPLDAGEITQEEAFEIGMQPLREFMYEQTQAKDLKMFCEIADVTYDPENLDDISVTVLIPSFIVSELRTAFIIGFLIYIPFIIIDMVVSSILMSMGMMMLPPTTISMPFKILLFILADGWNLVIGNLVKTFY